MNPEKIENLISYHTFMFPFRWDIASEKLSKSSPLKSIHEINKVYEDRLDVEKFKNRLLGRKQNKQWQYTWFDISTAEHYNEYTYFYPHARKAILNTNKEFMKDWVSHTFRCIDPECQYYKIYIQNSDSGDKNTSDQIQAYSLRIEKISLKIYDTGIGILQFDLENYRYGDPEDILRINDFGRRIYPPFLGAFSKENKERGVFAARHCIYPVCIDICSDETSQLPENKYERDEGYYNDHANLDPAGNQAVTILPEFIQTLLGDRFETRMNRLKKGDILLTPVIDDRMFVLSVYGDTRNSFHDDPEQMMQGVDDFWYRFVFVDGKSKGAANKRLERELVSRHTYDRWLESGTLFGMSRYSFMARIRGSFRDKYPKMILTHCKTMYYQMILLALTQRASIIRFSEEIAYVSSLNEKEPGHRDLNAIRDLYKHYIRFVNKVYFNEVTAQEQGCEMYAMIQDHMRIKENLTDLRQEIGELHTYADLTYEKKRGKKTDRLTIMAALFLIPTFITGFFGMNIFSDNFFKYYHDNRLVLFLQCPVAGYIVYGALFLILSLFFIFLIVTWFLDWRKH